MKQLEGFQVEGKEYQICLLKKSLYGLKQSPQQWYKKFNSLMLSVGFMRSKYDSFVYIYQLVDGSFLYLLFYVDDMLIVAKDLYEINHLKVILSFHFEMKDLGAIRNIWG